MTSPSPLQPDCYYHIFNRGNNRGDVFFEERNYSYILSLLEKHILPVAEIYVYFLLKNHFHLLVRVRDMDEIDNPETLKVSKTFSVSEKDINYASRKFSDLFNAYAKAINKAYGRTGSLFEHPFGRKLIDNSAYINRVVIYIHQNPYKHHFIDDFKDWKYSSYHEFLSDQPTIICRNIVDDWFEGENQFKAAHDEWDDRTILRLMDDEE
jgi:putative transposase